MLQCIGKYVYYCVGTIHSQVTKCREDRVAYRNDKVYNEHLHRPLTQFNWGFKPFIFYLSAVVWAEFFVLQEAIQALNSCTFSTMCKYTVHVQFYYCLSSEQFQQGGICGPLHLRRLHGKIQRWRNVLLELENCRRLVMWTYHYYCTHRTQLKR